MKNISLYLTENFQIVVVNFSVYLIRHVFVMDFDTFAHSVYIPM